jgi:hypothetical protein
VNDLIAQRLDQARADEVYGRIRPDVVESLLNYAYRGYMPGGFLEAVLCNDLAVAVGRADADNARTLKEIVTYVYMELPAPSWGGVEKVSKWVAQFQVAREVAP